MRWNISWPVATVASAAILALGGATTAAVANAPQDAATSGIFKVEPKPRDYDLGYQVGYSYGRADLESGIGYNLNHHNLDSYDQNYDFGNGYATGYMRGIDGFPS